jgi:hypothetical protein
VYSFNAIFLKAFHFNMTDPAKEAKAEAEKEVADIQEVQENEEADQDPTEEEGDKRPYRSKRARKSSEAFTPTNFKDVDKSVSIVSGRGTKLSDLDVVKDSVQGHTSTSDELLLAHKLLYSIRGGKPAKKDIKSNILAFSGYLAEKKDGEVAKKGETEEAEVREL